MSRSSVASQHVIAASPESPSLFSDHRHLQMGDKAHVAPLSFLEFNGRSKSNLGIGNTGTKTQSPRNFITVPSNHPSSNQRHEPFSVPSNIRLTEHQTKNRLLQSNIFRRPLPSSQPDSYAQQDHLFPIRMLGMKHNHHVDNSIASEFTQNQEPPSFQAHTTNSSAFLPENTSSPARSPSSSAFSLSHSETTLVSHQTKLDKLELPFPNAQGEGSNRSLMSCFAHDRYRNLNR
jgi:hypothetical protein